MPQSVPDDRPHTDLTRSILESAMRVQSALGVGLYEKPYKVCLAHALRQKGHRVLMEVKLDITFEGLLVPESYRIDVLSDRVVTHPKLVGGGPDPGSLREQQEDPRSFHDPGRNRLAPGPAFKLSAVLRRHL